MDRQAKLPSVYTFLSSNLGSWNSNIGTCPRRRSYLLSLIFSQIYKKKVRLFVKILPRCWQICKMLQWLRPRGILF